MGLNNYQEELLHDRKYHGWGDSDVFRVQSADGNQSCLKIYKPHIYQSQLEHYHALHNFLSQYPYDIPASFNFLGQDIDQIRFEVLALGDNITRASSLTHFLFMQKRIKKGPEVCVTTLPYIGGVPFCDAVRMDRNVYDVLMDARTKFINYLAKHFAMFHSPEEIDAQLCSCNMKCLVKGTTLQIIVLDLCGWIEDINTLSSFSKLELIKTLQQK